ncbi:MAG: S9 family peptidase [Henriciella sp.]
MRIRYFAVGLAAASLLSASSLFASAEPVPIEDLARLPAISSVSVTTDGNTMFGLVGPTTGNDQDRAVLASWDLNDLSKPPMIVAPDNDGSEFSFVSGLKNGNAFVGVRRPFTGRLSGCSEGKATGSTRTWLRQFMITDSSFEDFETPFLDESGMRGMSEATKTCLRLEARGSVISRLPLDPKRVMISRTDGRTFSSEVGFLDLDTGEVDVIYKNTDSRGRGYIDPSDGEIMSASGVDEKGNAFELEMYVRAAKGAEMEKHPQLSVDLSDRRELSIAHWDNEAGIYYVNTNKFSDKNQIHAYDPVKKEFVGEAVFAHPEFDAGGMVTSTSPNSFGQILGFSYNADVNRIEWVDPEVGGIALGLENAFKGQDINLIYVSDDRNRVVFSAEASNQPPRYFMFEDKAKLTPIAAQRPWIEPSHMGETDLIKYTARDGRELWALLTPRAGWQPGDAPGKAIVLPHGGPWARDFGGWDISGWVPFLTSRGFTVLQPQYRGSTGWGLDLWKAGDGQYGYKAQDDKDDAAAWLVSEGYAADDKIGIFGYSYGGYAAMAAATRANSPFQCAIAGAGYGESAKINVGVDRSRYGRMVFGDAISGRDIIKDVKNSEIPILVYHGDRDVRVQDTFGKAFYNAIKRHTTAKYVNIPDMPHSLPWTPEQHRLSLTAIEDFLYNECGLE